MTPAELIASLPDDAKVAVIVGTGDMTKGELAAALASSGAVYITTREAARRYSRTPRWWSREAESIPGAYKDRAWRLPVQGCEEHLARLIRPRRSRGPWNPTTSHPVDDRSSGIQAR